MEPSTGGTGPALPRTIPVADGRILTVRPISPDDADGLRLLYEGLTSEDRYRRFFSAFHPSREFLDKWCHIAEAGGAAVVVEVDRPVPHLVAEAGYARLPSGDGDFAITIAPEWRGWLGPYLLATLVEVAAADGVPNLQADILVENRTMLALVRHRGYAVLDHDGFTIVRVAIGVRHRMPVWTDPHEAPRVLVEAPSGRWHAEEAVRAAGFSVITCPGPDAMAPGRCPVLSGDPCPLVEGADVVVVALHPDRPTTAALLAGHRCHGGGQGVVVEDPGTSAQAVVAALRVLFPKPSAEAR